MPVPPMRVLTSAIRDTFSRSSHTGSTLNDRFGRSIPVANSGIESASSPRTSLMSARTAAVDVAVSAIVRGEPNSCLNSPTL